MPHTAATRFRSAARGATLIETALTLLVVLLVIFGTFELCMMVHAKSVLSDAANEGVRYAIVHSSDATVVDSTRQKVSDYAKYTLHDVSGITTDVAFPDGTSEPPNRVQVTVTLTYAPFVNLFGWKGLALTSYAEGRTVY